ncbi:hypothetical protein APHAL10511_003242 [Amanita phalloides]|nr:hypothetical protein APHAL10511_003242 [Amanita phalloides]
MILSLNCLIIHFETLLQSFAKLPVHVFSKAKDDLALTLPDDLSIVPQRILDVSLQRMQSALIQPNGHPDRRFALKLLRRLPEEHLAQLPSSYISMRDLGADVEPESPTGNQGREEQTSVWSAKNNRWRSPLRHIKTKWHKASFVGLLIQLAPMSVLRRVSPSVIDLIPTSSMVLIPTSALERLPTEYLAHVPTQYLERLPLEHLLNFPESLLSKVPRTTIERLPTSLLERLPEEFLRKLPVEFLDNLAEDLTDLIREVIQSSVFGSEELRQQLSGLVKDKLRTTLVVTSGELRTTVIQVSVLTNEKKRTCKAILNHEGLQKHILDITRIHSKTVAQIPLLGMGEEEVYNGLRAKTEEMWQVMRLHPSLHHHS